MIYDISPRIDEQLRVWPGDTPPTRDILCSIDGGDNLTLSTLHTTVHLGAHVDAPSHYGADAPAIDERSLDYYIGRCRVIRVKAKRGTRVTPRMIKTFIDAPRLLLATGTYPNPAKFNRSFAALSPDLIATLHESGVILVGIDTPSVDLFESRDLPAHKACLAHDMAILEGIVLRDVPEGVYELIALPLKLAGFDASPVRAVLRSLE